jgi:hypothetical protein
MTVIIQQSKIADFIVELANSDWPIQVRRFQVGTNPYAKEAAGARPDESGMMGPMSGFSSPDLSSSSFESSPSFESSSGFSGGPMGFAAAGPSLPNPYGQNLPPFAMAALGHPDLVRLDLCGVITMYRQPKEAIAAVDARKAAQAAEAPANAPATMPAAASQAAPVAPEQPSQPASADSIPAPTAAAAPDSAAAPASPPETAPGPASAPQNNPTTDPAIP